MESNLFIPYKALGLFCSSVPPIFVPSHSGGHNQGLVVCALGNQLCGFIVNPFRPVLTVEPLELEITLLAADQHRFYAALGDFVAIIRQDNVQHRLVISNGGAKLLLSLTDVLVVVDMASTIHVFDVENGQPMVQLESSSSFEATAILHPHTYLNKILLGSSDGRLRLWNLKTGKLVHEFPAPNENSIVTIRVLEQSPAVDIIGIGLSDGQIQLRNIKFDKVLCTFRQQGQITALAFRTDGIETLTSASTDGSIAVWDLNERLLIGQLNEAHKAPITWLHFMLGQPLLLSAGEDNRFAKWFFRNENSLPELYNHLEGHCGPVTTLKFCTDDYIISASRDGHVRRFSTKKMNGIKDFGLAREVRRGDLSKDRFIDVPLNAISQIELSHGREAVWDNMICRHEESPLVSTWSSRYMKRGTHLLYHARFAKNPELLTAFASCAFVSNCGNFALIGYSSGHVDVFSMQSGNYKFSFEEKRHKEVSSEQSKKMGRKEKSELFGRAHKAPVVGVVLDIFNRSAVTAAADGSIHFWKFSQPPTLLSRMHLTTGVRLFQMDLSNSLLAVGLDNGEIGLLDILCRRLARRFFHYACIEWSNESHLTALEFSGDGKWLLSADNQGFIKVWDLAASTLIDVMHCALPCIGMAFSTSGDFLATCHEGQRAIYLWANKLLFLTGSSLCSKSIDELHERVTTTSLPGIVRQSEEKEKVEDEDMQSEMNESVHSQERVVVIDEEEEENGKEAGRKKGINQPSISTNSLSEAMFSSSIEARGEEEEQLYPDLFKLSGLAPAKWVGLPILNLLRERNKAKQPSKNSSVAPFFLPTVETPSGFLFESLKKQRVISATEEDVERNIAVATRRLGTETLRSKWLNQLMSAKSNSDLYETFNQMKGMSVSSLDFQIRSLNCENELKQFLTMLVAVLESRKNFDLIQSYTATFLNIHHEKLYNCDDDKYGQMKKRGDFMILKRLMELQKQAMDEIDPLFDQAISLTEFIKSAVI